MSNRGSHNPTRSQFFLEHLGRRMNLGTREYRFPEIHVRGTPRARGQAHGETLRGAIRDTYTFYMERLFAGGPLTPEAIEARARQVLDLVARRAPRLAAEIEGIAAGAGLPAWQVGVLNARTEILNARGGECSTTYFGAHHVLAQTWDWVEPLEAQCAVLVHARDDGHRHVRLVEPGMLAKIGLNDSGLGVCLNILFAPHDLDGLPVHVLIAEILACTDFAAARAALEQAGLGKASHLLVADAAGQAVSMEYMGGERHALAPSTACCSTPTIASRTAPPVGARSRPLLKPLRRLAAAVAATRRAIRPRPRHPERCRARRSPAAAALPRTGPARPRAGGYLRDRADGTRRAPISHPARTTCRRTISDRRLVK